MRPYRRHLILGTIYAIIGAGASAYSPTLLGQAIDALLRGIDFQVLALYSLGLIHLTVTLSIFRFLLACLLAKFRRHQLPHGPGSV